jgi:hypothetical protein
MLQPYCIEKRKQQDGRRLHQRAADGLHNTVADLILLTGAGKTFDNSWAPLTLTPDGTFCVGSWDGAE